MCFHKVCVPEASACYKSSVHSLLCDVFCHSMEFPEFPLGFPPLLLSIAEVKGFFVSATSRCNVKAIFTLSRAFAKLVDSLMKS